MLRDSGSLDKLLDGIRAAADPSRLRLLAICSQGEWTVSELVQILGQSQPRISRHLKILAEAGLLDRFREGSWVFYRRAQTGEGARLAPFALPPAARRRRRHAAGPAAAGGGARGAPAAGRALFRRAAPTPGTASATWRSTARGRDGAARAVRGGAAGQPARHRHRHRPHPPGAGGAGRLRARHRPQPRHAGGGPRQSRPARGAQLPGPPRRHVPAAAAGRLVRRRDPASGAAFRRRPVRRAGRGRRVLAPGGWLVVVDLARARAGAAARAERPSPARLRRRGDRPLVRGARPAAGAAAPARRAGAHRGDLDRPAPAGRRRRRRRPFARRSAA